MPWRREYGELVGGTFIEPDENARFFSEWMDRYDAILEPAQWPNSYGKASMEIM